MNEEQQKFLEYIKAQLKGQPKFGLREEVFFPLRYDPERPLDYEDKEIAKELMPEDPRLGKENYSASITTTSGNVRKAIEAVYKKEMEADGLSFPKRKKGERGAWEPIYKWLWNYKFPRWAYPVIWKNFQEKAQKVSFEWLKFFKEGEEILTYNSRLKLPSAQPPKKPSIIVNERQLMSIDLPDFNGYLLLLNKGSDYVVCPSKAFATNYQINGKLTLPQPETPAKKQGIMFTYEDLRIEEFTAIALDRPLDLAWLDVNNTEEMAARLTPDRMMELWQQLEGRTDWRVYYEAFEVVEE